MAAERGQASVEWTAIVLLVAIVLGGAVAAAGLLDVAGLARLVRCSIVRGCAEEGSALAVAYGEDVAGQVRRRAPALLYAPGVFTLPVDFRRCRSHACADAPPHGTVSRSARGEPATAFTRVVDRRPAGGDLFVQYWLYYPDSTWVSSHLPSALGGHHADDWESYQVRIDASGRTRARASAHEGYAGRRRPLEICQAGDRDGRVLGLIPLDDCAGWIEATGATRVSRGSHAGHIVDATRPPGGGGRRFASLPPERRTRARDLRLVPLETLGADALDTPFAITPPWRKPVYRDPERNDT